ncbi:MAG: hypothetical protein LBM56_01620, partial [Burkholderiaceae bacterium]|nr:hypothetical protein [Burkholderiaceae bacterium]
LQTVCWFRDGRILFPPCDKTEAITRLAELLRLYRQGLTEPLRFFPASANAYIANDNRIDKAHAQWETGYGGYPGEGDDPFNRLATRGMAEPLDEVFAECAQKVLSPMQDHMSKVMYGDD